MDINNVTCNTGKKWSSTALAHSSINRKLQKYYVGPSLLSPTESYVSTKFS